MDSIISTFHIEWKTLLTQAINFSLVLLVLYIFALKPVSKLMKERTAKIEKGIADAAENRKLLEQSKKKYEEQLAKARREANVIFLEMKKEVEKKKADMLADAKKEVNRILENGRKTLENEKTKMVGEAKKEVATLAIKITEKLLMEEVGPSFQEKAVEEVNKL